ncbi:MAG: hypothetical protein GQ529_02940 [Methyloprofundus sp.]|nr:hypothetical protein [Methyloprofundus sp.]
MKKLLLTIAIASLIPLTSVEAKDKDNVFTGSWISSNDGDVTTLPEAREGACLGRVDNRLIMTHGYSEGDTGHVRIYNVNTDTWHTGATSPNRRSEGVGATYMGDVFCIGGRVRTIVERYRLSDNTWTTMSPMNVARGGPAADVFEYEMDAMDFLGEYIIDPKIYVFGGRNGATPFNGDVLDSAEVYDIKTNTWSAITPPPTPVSDARAVTKGGKIFLIGGAIGSPQESSALLQIYDPYDDSWEAGPDMDTPRANHAAAYIGNTIYVIGGALRNSETNDRLDTVEAYDVDKGQWTADLAVKPNGSNETHAVRIANKLYLPGSGLGGASREFFDVFSRK